MTFLLAVDRHRHQVPNVEVHRSFDDVRDEWELLANRCRASAFAHPGWFEAWWEAFGAGELHIVTVRDDLGRLQAVAPLARRGRRLRSLTNWHSPELTFPCADDVARRQLVGALVASGYSVSLRFLDIDGVDAEAVQDVGNDRLRVAVRTLERSPFVPIAGEWATFEDALGRARRAELRRRRRRLEEEGRLTVELADGTERLGSLLEEGFAVEGSGWKARKGTAIASRPETRRFYTDIARWAAPRDWLRLAFLRLDGRPIAFEYLIVHDGVLSLLKGGYDQAFRAQAPGVLLTHAVLERAFADGARSYEFLGTDEPFKMVWTDHVRVRVAIDLFPTSVEGTLRWSAEVYGRPIARRVRGLVRR